MRNVGETFTEHRIDHGIVRQVAKIDDDVANISPRATGLVKKSVNIVPHSHCLTPYVARIHDFAFIVDAGRTRNEHMTAVAVVDVGATFKRHTVFIGGIDIVGSVEIAV